MRIKHSTALYDNVSYSDKTFSNLVTIIENGRGKKRHKISQRFNSLVASIHFTAVSSENQRVSALFS